MRITLLLIFCGLTLTASAQFWKKKPKPVVEVVTRYPDADPPVCFTDIIIPAVITNVDEVSVRPIERSTYDIEMNEEAVMTQAKHHMRFREYKLASYNFSDLADLYILQNRFSEAKWYLLQSLTISKEQGDDRHTLANLLNLAAIKIAIGEPALARADLKEAHELAFAKCFISDITNIETRMREMDTNGTVAEKVTLRYAKAVEANNKSLK
jgi:hypothetical protein